MIAYLLKYFARKSHNVRVQLLLATLYGLVDIYGLRGAFAVMMKARKLTNMKPGNRVTAKKDTPTS